MLTQFSDGKIGRYSIGLGFRHLSLRNVVEFKIPNSGEEGNVSRINIMT